MSDDTDVRKKIVELSHRIDELEDELQRRREETRELRDRIDALRTSTFYDAEILAKRFPGIFDHIDEEDRE